MYLQSLHLHNHRNLQNVTIELSKNLNAFAGHNGAGKTSILEAIDLLVRGRSFRTSNISNVIRQGLPELQIDSWVIDDNGLKRRFSLRKGAQHNHSLLDGERIKRQSAFTSQLPVILIHPNVGELISGGPSERRSFLDWGLFHVEPEFPGCYRRFHRLLQQRNAAIKQRNRKMVQATSIPFAKEGTALDQMRRAYIKEIDAESKYFLRNLTVHRDISLHYQRGWTNDKDLLGCLDREADQLASLRHSGHGPQRADVLIYWEQQQPASEASRGQQKQLAIALMLAQATHLRKVKGKTPVLLIDELPAELDQQKIGEILYTISKLDLQVLITCVSKELIQEHWKTSIQWFHVEHGTVARML